MSTPDSDAAADLLEAALFGRETVISEKQAEADLDRGLPLIEDYSLLRLLGEGGFGMVYEAEQRVPIQRRVAVKVLRPGLQTREILARFEQERQALALMNHPHIAKIFDAGETDDGRPFIVMELVEGTTIDQHAKTLGLREKLTLMRDVCRAVAHAHHKGVIHRDLKPSNILIATTHDGQFEPRVIDFGIAKALDGPLVSQILFTQIRQVVGTPGYMSPERLHTSQIPASADTRTDVFALGAILWELLTGKTPVQTYDSHGTRVVLPESGTLPAELRWITEKATDPDMNRRYANADVLADDCEAWLEGQPLKAAPYSLAYLITKWAARHRVAAVALAGLMLSLLLFLAVLVQKNQEIRRALARSETSQMERLRASSNENYSAGMMRERKRPAQALAHWAQALRDDPGNLAALGMALSTLRHRAFPRPVVPAVALPKGEPRELAVSTNGKWTALVVHGIDDKGGETLVRCRQGDAEAFSIPIPADGRMTLLSISDEGVVAVAGPSGPVGLLGVDGTWAASDRELAGLRGIVWAPDGRLWMVGALEVARCDTEGREVGDVSGLPGPPAAWAASPDGRFLAFGMEAGKVMLLSAENTAKKTFAAPVPAPFAKIAINEDGTGIAAAWNSGEVWLSAERGPGITFSGDPVLSLRFLADDSGLLIQTPSDLRVVEPTTGAVSSKLILTTPLHAVLPVGDALLTQVPFGRPVIRPLADLDLSEDLLGVEGRVTFEVSAWGDMLVLVDEENQILEWLRKDPTVDPVHVKADKSEWLTMTPALSGAGWFAVDKQGHVHSESGPLWQAGRGVVRLVAVDALGETVLIDDEPVPGVFLVRPDSPTREHQPWGKASALALSPSGRLAVLGYPDGEVRVFDVMTKTQVAQHDWKRGAVTALSFIGSSRIAVAASSQVRVWEWETGEVLPSPIDLPGKITAMAPDRAGIRLAAASDDALHVIDVESGRRIVGQLKGPKVARYLAWDDIETQTVSAYDGEGLIYSFAMPPTMELAPVWLPNWIENHCGVRIDDEADLVRIRATDKMSLPTDAEEGLKTWLTGEIEQP